MPDLEVFKSQLEGTGEREVSTTMAFVRVLAALLRDKQIGDRVVPIVPDESRTFGMEGMFRQLGIYSHVGQLYEPEDAGSMMFYKEDQQGQILQEGINEAGAMSAWIAAATSYSNHAVQMIPFYVFYSMFGFQRVGDLAWAAGDSRARGFLLGGTAGRTTLNGEGLQHEDGHSHVLAATVPNCVSYDPAYGYEVAVIVREGLRRMIGSQEDVFYYLTIANENYVHPQMPEGAEEGILRGHVPGQGGLGEAAGRAAARLRADPARGARRGRVAGLTTSMSTPRSGARRAGRSCAATGSPPSARRDSALPASVATPGWKGASAARPGAPVVATSDYMKALPDGIREWVHGRFASLGTDGFGRSDWRRELRSFFEIDSRHVAVAALQALADDGKGPRSAVKGAIEKYGIDPDKPDPAVS